MKPNGYLLFRNSTIAVIATGWVKLVYGNDGWDVICDYHTSLDPFMPQTLALVEKLSA